MGKLLTGKMWNKVRNDSCGTMGSVRVRNQSTPVFHMLPAGNFCSPLSAFYPWPAWL